MYSIWSWITWLHCEFKDEMNSCRLLNKGKNGFLGIALETNCEDQVVNQELKKRSTELYENKFFGEYFIQSEKRASARCSARANLVEKI